MKKSHVSDPRRQEITQILIQLGSPGIDQKHVSDRLYGAVYDELRKIADRLMRAEKTGHTLQPTALVHEAYIRKARLKRGGEEQRVTWDESHGISRDPTYETLALDSALTRLAKLDQRMERIVELRVFGGMTLKEIAQALGISRRTVDDDWVVAKQCLTHELAD
jgi:RNA polymerase sigma factor (sigma-70 family)